MAVKGQFTTQLDQLHRRPLYIAIPKIPDSPICPVTFLQQSFRYFRNSLHVLFQPQSTSLRCYVCIFFKFTIISDKALR